MPISMAPQTMSIMVASPILWPSVRGSPRARAQRPLPSITTATWRGISSLGIAGGTAPDGCFGAGCGRVPPGPTPGSSLGKTAGNTVLSGNVGL
ncbi:Uncharacterised protein [Mycobacteroides abscessus subsp. abscessus]|nr:Uncharacterised protein [Mycobacteroides abscessus subsp. abscessus]